MCGAPPSRFPKLCLSDPAVPPKLARRDRQNFDCATWLHKARELPKEEFQRAVERRSGDAAVLDEEILQIPTWRAATDISGRLERESLMSSPGPKFVGVRLDPVAYESLRQQVLRRDGWRCQVCGTLSNLEVHHKQFRGHSGDDCEQNLITRRHRRHSKLHD